MSTDAEKTVQCIEETLLAYCRQQGLFKSGQSHCSLLRWSRLYGFVAFFASAAQRLGHRSAGHPRQPRYPRWGGPGGGPRREGGGRRGRGGGGGVHANFVTAFCRRNGVELFLYDAEKEGVPIPPQPSEEWARELRYTWFDQLAAREEALIATAHTCSDQAETLLFRMARGTGLHGLAGIPPCRGIYRRPCLCLTSDETQQY